MDFTGTIFEVFASNSNQATLPGRVLFEDLVVHMECSHMTDSCIQ